jgi:pimeloyl-ACP methyl ester carboxylesterase
MPECREVWVSSADGLRLYAQDNGPLDSKVTSILCLPGLTRNSRDFETVVTWLAAGRRVICCDFRGRGRSQCAPDPMTYRADVEADDTFRLLDHLGIMRVGIIGTSRGGIVAMFMAAKAKERIAGVFFNDIGPVLEIGGLLRIRSYLGKASVFSGWEEAVAALKDTNRGHEGLSEAQWLAFARRVFREDGGRLVPDYDLKLGSAFPSTEDIAAGKFQPVWPLFDGLAGLPVSILRGENSDLLSAQTVAEMAVRHPGLDATIVPDRAHVPFLDEPEARAAIERWLVRVN